MRRRASGDGSRRGGAGARRRRERASHGGGQAHPRLDRTRPSNPYRPVANNSPTRAQIKSLARTQLAPATSHSTLQAEFRHDPFSPHALDTLTERHVAETVRLVSASSIVRDAWDAGARLEVHGWMYHVATARLHDLGIGVKGGELPFFPWLAGRGRETELTRAFLLPVGKLVRGERDW